MPIRPDNISKYGEIDLKLGIKSSLPRVKGTIALAILLWECSNRPSELIYSVQKDSSIVISSKLNQQIVDYLADICSEDKIESDLLITTINQNQLFKSQLEALIVAFELIWKIAKVSFEDTNKAASAERTGGNRYPKKLNYTINADIIHYLIESNRDAYLRVLMFWSGIKVNFDTDYESRLTHLLCALSEEAVFKLIDGENSIVFNQNSIYKKLLETHQVIDINGDKEAKGSLRILKSLLSDSLNPFLTYSNSGSVDVANNCEEELAEYQHRVETFLQLSARKIDINNTDVLSQKSTKNPSGEINHSVFSSGFKSSFQRNRIIFGAPGTGKSYRINKEVKKLLQNGGDYERVTFHPDYSYANFVGTYKPVPYIREDGQKGITYEYVPGPFSRVLVAALKNVISGDEAKPYVLIVEEINRANMAAVFGDVFQLLDRDSSNVSEYPIHASEDMKKYLAQELGGSEEDYCKIKLPDNMFIWAMMNSADQGVFPMDTAFKRRWDFTYLGVNSSEDEIKDAVLIMGEGIYARVVSWNNLRKAVNNELLNFGVNEDKLMGTFFISKNVIDAIGDDSGKQFKNVFKNKVIMYLFDDAAKRKVTQLFNGCSNSKLYSEIVKEFDTKGVAIFMDDIKNEFKDIPSDSSEADEK